MKKSIEIGHVLIHFVVMIKNLDPNLFRFLIEIRDDYKIFQNFARGQFNCRSLTLLKPAAKLVLVLKLVDFFLNFCALFEGHS